MHRRMAAAHSNNQLRISNENKTAHRKDGPFI